MNLGDRLLMIARQRLKQGLSLDRETSPHHSDAQSELDEFLQEPAAPRPSAPHPYSREYRILGLTPGADFKQVQARWRELVRETHPDRIHFNGDREAEARATDHLRRINEAYARLKAYLGE